MIEMNDVHASVHLAVTGDIVGFVISRSLGLEKIHGYNSRISSWETFRDPA